MSETKQMPLIGNTPAAKLPSPEEVQHDPELMAVVQKASMSALIGQRDEALSRCADLFTQLSVTQHLLERAIKENAELKLDVQSLQNKAKADAVS